MPYYVAASAPASVGPIDTKADRPVSFPAPDKHDAPASFESLTTVERTQLDVSRNLADAHARQQMSPAEQASVLDRFSGLFALSRDMPYVELESRAAGAFLASLGQSPPRRRFFTLYSSSIATMVVARALAEARRRTSLTSPTFDNIHALLSASGVVVTPRLVGAQPPNAFTSTQGCVFEVTPNNPTGDYLTEPELRELALACVESDTWLVLDQSFKGHDARACFDHYSVLEETGVSYIVIEDTGKLWPTLDLKASFVLCSDDLVSRLEPIVDDVLLNVSPFILQLIRTYSEFSIEDGYDSVRSVISTNRRYLRDQLRRSDGALSCPCPGSRVGVEVVDLDANRGRSCREWLDRFEAHGLGVLDTSYFYWHEPEVNHTQLRISLCRDPDYFSSGVDQLLTLVMS